MTPIQRSKVYHFAVVVHGECCAHGHLWIVSHRAHSLQDAEARLLADVRRQGYEPTEYAQLESANEDAEVIGVTEDWTP